VFLPSIPTLLLRLAPNQWQLRPSRRRSIDAGIQCIMPSATTLQSRSTRNQRGNCGLILAAVHLYRILQLTVFNRCPFTLASTCSVDVGMQDIMPSMTTLYFRSTRNQRGNYDPIFATVCLYRILQLDIFNCCPLTLAYICQVDVGIQGIVPSALTLTSRSTRNQRSNCGPPCICTESSTLMSSSSVHLPSRPAVRAMLGSK
jgi:hypothetical protein